MTSCSDNYEITSNAYNSEVEVFEAPQWVSADTAFHKQYCVEFVKQYSSLTLFSDTIWQVELQLDKDARPRLLQYRDSSGIHLTQKITTKMDGSMPQLPILVEYGLNKQADISSYSLHSCQVDFDETVTFGTRYGYSPDSETLIAYGHLTDKLGLLQVVTNGFALSASLNVDTVAHTVKSLEGLIITNESGRYEYSIRK